ncbi:glycerol-3-phosphate 1-O-acyltransferase PlsY [Alkalicella caledoniensis]|uniref:Glycerol-3-phosphate acyltransferase n=1 Tax=Alkalicella caledoniensis TaxID=2731377 RepID=A0A7G9WD14_ALKCA|nr:glycerol-3-phosphate 1-O-acyltransferase PlsY [Alkalicella caledoniensis]
MLVLIGYLLGSISFSYIAGRLFGKMDIREHGSKNAGATNVLRNVGVKAFIFASVLDILKGVAAVQLAKYFYPEQDLLIVLTAGAAIIGHNWPLFFGFKGGKGIATTVGVLLGLNAPAALIVMVTMAIIVYITRYVSLASLVGTALLPILIYYFVGANIYYMLFAFIVAIMAWYKHRANIGRLIKGIESKIGEKK